MLERPKRCHDLRFIADPAGRDVHYKLNDVLPTFACPETIHVGGPEHYGMLVKVVGENGEYEREPKFHSSNNPPVSARLQSLALQGNIAGLATLAAQEGQDQAFWHAIKNIRQNRLSMRDSRVTAVIECPDTLIIGEPFSFTYRYVGNEQRLPDSHEADWLSIYMMKDSGGGVGGAPGADKDTLIARFRPPHKALAEVQLRHAAWLPGLYQVRLSLVNSDTVVARSNVMHVKYATASLSCKEEIIVDDSCLDLAFVLDYRKLVHPTSDWIGVFPKAERFLTAHHALRRAHVPSKNLGIVSIDLRGLEGPHQIVYFQEFPDRSVILGHCETVFIPKPPQAPQKFIKSSKPPSELRHVKFYISGTFADLEEERMLLMSKVAPRLKSICDERHMSVILMDMRFGMTSDGESVGEDASSTLIERCLTELDSCLPYFLCILGHVYGHVPKKLPWRVAQLYPWLNDNRFQNARVTHGAHMSLTEMEIANAVLIDPSLAPNARFYLRDQSYTLGRGVQFQDTEEWAKVAMNLLKVKVRKTVEGSQKTNPAKCMAMHAYFNPKHFAELVTKDIVGILDVDYPKSLTPSDLTLFWLTMDEASSKHMKKTNAQLRREMQALDTVADQIDHHVNEAMVNGTGSALALYGEEGCGKTCLTVRWTQRRIAGGPLLSETGDIRDKCTSYTCFTDSKGRNCLVSPYSMLIPCHSLRIHRVVVLYEVKASILELGEV